MEDRQSAFAKASARLADVRRAGPIYVSAKRTHFTFDYFSMDHIYSQGLARFVEAFANGFVFQNEPILRGVLRTLSLKNGFVSGERSHSGGARR